VFAAAVLRVIDGDSIEVAIPLLPPQVGDLRWREEARLARCNAREHNEPGGQEATANLAALLPAGTQVTVKLLRRDNYGRLLAEVWLLAGANLTDHLVAGQWAATWNGRGQKPLPLWPRPQDSAS